MPSWTNGLYDWATAGVRHGSNSIRPIETVTPLAELLERDPGFELICAHLKNDPQPLIDDVLTRQGPVPIAWENKVIPTLIGFLPRPPKVPCKRLDDRFNIVWISDSVVDGWSFSQLPQLLLLKGDSQDSIV